jgi:hypothetical protein
MSIILSCLVGAAVGYGTKAFFDREIKTSVLVTPETAFVLTRFQKRRYKKFAKRANIILQKYIGAMHYEHSVKITFILANDDVERIEEQRVLNHLRDEFITQGWDVDEQEYIESQQWADRNNKHRSRLNFRLTKEFQARQKAVKKEAKEILNSLG